MTDYITVDELKQYINLRDTTDDDLIQSFVTAASRMIDNDCGYYPGRLTLAANATAQTFRATQPYRLQLPDIIGTTSGLIITTDQNDDGVFETTWQTADYELWPLNALANSEPVNELRVVGNNLFPTWSFHSAVQITAKWGWPATPDLVKAACKVAAKEMYASKDTRNGVANFDEYGAIRVREDPIYRRMLGHYARAAVA